MTSRPPTANLLIDDIITRRERLAKRRAQLEVGKRAGWSPADLRVIEDHIASLVTQLVGYEQELEFFHQLKVNADNVVCDAYTGMKIE